MEAVHIALEGITKTYDDVVAVDSIDLSVNHGEFLTLLGPSGCGKTTTLRMVAGFVAPTRGLILAHGADITALPPQKRPTAMVFQHYALFPHMTVAANVGFGLTVRGLPRAEIDRRVRGALDVVRLEGFDNRYPTQLSGGQQQRVALARALAVEPEVILLDEPLGSLDAKLREALQLELKRIHRSLRITMIYVTHDQEEALSMSDRIAVMNRGRIVQIGTPDAIYRFPTNRFVADFVGKVNLIPGWVEPANPQTFKTKEGGQYVVRPPVAPERTTPALLVIRPEQMGFSEPGARPNEIRGTIDKIRYTGACYQYFILTQSQLTVVVEERALSPARRVGDSVTVAWSPEHALVIFEDLSAETS